MDIIPELYKMDRVVFAFFHVGFNNAFQDVFRVGFKELIILDCLP